MRTNLTFRKADRLYQRFQRIESQGGQPETLGDDPDHPFILGRVCRGVFILILILISFQFLADLSGYQLSRTLG